MKGLETVKAAGVTFELYLVEIFPKFVLIETAKWLGEYWMWNNLTIFEREELKWYL